MTDTINKGRSETVKFVVTLHLSIEQRNKLQQLAIKDNRQVGNYVETIIIKKITYSEVIPL